MSPGWSPDADTREEGPEHASSPGMESSVLPAYSTEAAGLPGVPGPLAVLPQPSWGGAGLAPSQPQATGFLLDADQGKREDRNNH